MHTRIRDVVPRPTRPHGHCQLGVTRIICAIILDNRRHRLVVNEENLHTMPLVTVYMVLPFLPPAPLPFAGTANKCVPHRMLWGGREQRESRREKTRNYRKGHWSPRLLLTTSMYPVLIPINFHCIHHRKKTGRCINNSEIGRIKWMRK